MSSSHVFRFAALAAFSAILGVEGTVSATPPPQDTPWLWPLYEAGNAWPADASTSTPRPVVSNTMGEYQTLGDPSPHPGIDLLGNAGDVVLFPSGGEIVYISNAAEYTAPLTHARIWVQSTEAATTGFLYYLGHVRSEWNPLTDEGDPRLREAIELSLHRPAGELLDPTIAIERGVVAGRLADWQLTSIFAYHHVHLGVLDAGDEFSCVDPLAFLDSNAAGSVGEPLAALDDEDPVIASLELRARDAQSSVLEDGLCGREVRGAIDVLLDATDTYYTRNPEPHWFPVRDTLHHEVEVFGASYTVRRVDAAVGETRLWYESPQGCQGTECGLWRLRYPPDRARATLGELFVLLKDGPPSYDGRDIAPYLWDAATTTAWDVWADLADPVHYVHYLSNGVKEDGTVVANGWDTTAVSDGRYVLTGTTWDRAGNLASTSEVVTVNNGGVAEAPADAPAGWASVYIADHPGDVGQVRSDMGGEPFFQSPDILVEDQASTIPCGAKVGRGAALVVGESYDVSLRVRNNGCLPVSGVSGLVYSAVPSAPLADLRAVNPSGDYEAPVTVPAGDVACIGPFSWTPTEEELDSTEGGHRCLLAAIDSPVAAGPSRDSMASWDVAGAANIAQRNLQIDKLSFMVRNPEDGPRAARLAIDLDGFETEYPDAYFEVLIEEVAGEDLVGLWVDTANIGAPTRETVDGVTYVVVRVLGDEVSVVWALPAVSERRVQARYYPPGVGNHLHHVEVSFYLEEDDKGGMIFDVQEYGLG